MKLSHLAIIWSLSLSGAAQVQWGEKFIDPVQEKCDSVGIGVKKAVWGIVWLPHIVEPLEGYSDAIIRNTKPELIGYLCEEYNASIHKSNNMKNLAALYEQEKDQE